MTPKKITSPLSVDHVFDGVTMKQTCSVILHSKLLKRDNYSPEVVVESISGGIGVSAVIKNDGNATATNFDWSITTDGTVFIGKEKTGIATLEPGESTTIKTGLMLGFGAITVTVKADTATKSQDFKLLLIFVK